jgi:hypothetical protein
MKKLYLIVLKGNEKVWGIDIMLHPEDYPTYSADFLPITPFPCAGRWEEFKSRFLPRGERYGIELEGETSRWSFPIYLTDDVKKAMEGDGVEVFEITNVIPKWVIDRGFARAWCFFQDLFNFRWKEMFLNKEELL